MRGLLLVCTLLWAWLVPAAQAAVIVEARLPLQGVERTTIWQGTGMREELRGTSAATSLILPDENRMLALDPVGRAFEERPLGAVLGELGAMQRAMAKEARLLEETIDVEKAGEDTIAGMACARYRLTWQARVATADGEKRYTIRESLRVSHAPKALAARKAMLRHLRALAGRFGVTLHPEQGDIWLFDIGRMLLGVPARKLVVAQWNIGGFALETEREIDFGGMLLEPVMRGVARRRAEERGEKLGEAGPGMSEIQAAMRRLQSPEIRARMREAMQRLQDPETQAKLRRYISPEQVQAMRRTMDSMARGEGPAAMMAGGKLRIAERVTAIRLVDDDPGLLRPPPGYAWRTPAYTTPEAREAPDKRDGDGALSAGEIRRLIREAQGGGKPAGADAYYAPVPRSAAPWMAFYREWEGVPYRWGGTSKDGVDCSGLTQNAYAAVPRLHIPRTTAEQIRQGRRVPLHDARPGDLVFFDTGYRHVGVYIGQNKFFHASSSKGVTLSTLANAYWSRTFREMRRIP